VGGVPEHFNLPLHLALEKAAFGVTGVEVDYRDFPGGTGAMTRSLKDNEIDIAIVLFEGAVANVLRGNAIKIVKVYVQSPLIWGVHVAAESSFKKIGDVRGRRYAISRHGSGSHLMAIVDACERGWKTEDMNFVRVGGLSGAREALANDEADAFLWERYMAQPYVENGEFRRIGERIAPWPAFVVAVRENILAARAIEIRKVFEVVDAECQGLMSNPDAIDLIAARYQLEPHEAREWFAHVRWHIGFDEPTEDLERVIGYLEHVGIVDTEGAKPADVWRSLDQLQATSNERTIS
jgi:ABC-type nitrate/sulfonate/bicarbonate transport system substrate-binding protein